MNRKSNIEFLSALALIVIIAGSVATLMYIRTPTGFAYTTNLANRLGLSKKSMCIFIPNQPVDFGRLDTGAFQTWNEQLQYIINPQNLSIVKSDAFKKTAFRQRFVPSDKGSERVVASLAIEARATYELKQNVLFEEGFDWGDEAKSGKFGFGFGGGSAPAGGKTDKDGFTARLAWKGQEDGTANASLYLYSSDRSLNLPYGDSIAIPGFTIPIGETVEVALRLTVNSQHHLADGKISVRLNDKILLERENIQWQVEGELPAIDKLLFSSFHGGNSTAWSPAETVYAQFSDICLFN